MYFNTEFMSIYEELLALHESSTGTITKSGTKITELKKLVSKYRDILNTVCQGVTSSKGVGIFLAPDETRPYYTKAIAKVQTAADRENNIEWRYGLFGPMPGPRNQISDMLNNIDEQINFNLDSCWVGFFVVGKDKISTLAEPLITALTDRTPELQWNNEVLLTKSGSLFKGGFNNNKNVFGICVKYSSIADSSTLTSFVDLISAVDMAQSILDNSADKSILDDTPMAVNDTDMNTFLQTFITKYPDRIQYEKGLDGTYIPKAIHVPTLVNFYLEHLEMGSAIRQTLAKYFNSVTLEPNPKQPWKSVQYLYNAIQQEYVMSKILTPNETATNAGADVSDSHQYLISGRASSSTDFLYGLHDDDNSKLKIDAKQGHYKKDTIVEIDHSHRADYIVYFAYEGLRDKNLGVHAIKGDWILYRAIPKYADLYIQVSKPKTEAEKQLLDLVNGLTKTLNLVNLKKTI